MKRLTTDAPEGNFETMLNFVHGKDGWAHIYDGDGKEVPLTTWALNQCHDRGCDEFDPKTLEEIDEELCDCMMDFPDCPIALAYCFASQACHLRDRLKMYEDVLFAEDGSELLSLDDLRDLAAPNGPLTLNQLREMDGEPVWLAWAGHPQAGWALVRVWSKPGNVIYLSYNNGVTDIAEFVLNDGGKIYRRKPEEGTNE